MHIERNYKAITVALGVLLALTFGYLVSPSLLGPQIAAPQLDPKDWILLILPPVLTTFFVALFRWHSERERQRREAKGHVLGIETHLQAHFLRIARNENGDRCLQLGWITTATYGETEHPALFGSAARAQAYREVCEKSTENLHPIPDLGQKKEVHSALKVALGKVSGVFCALGGSWSEQLVFPTVEDQADPGQAIAHRIFAIEPGLLALFLSRTFCQALHTEQPWQWYRVVTLRRVALHYFQSPPSLGDATYPYRILEARIPRRDVHDWTELWLKRGEQTPETFGESLAQALLREVQDVNHPSALAAVPELKLYPIVSGRHFRDQKTAEAHLDLAEETARLPAMIKV